MFVVRDEYIFDAPVTVRVPTDGGQHIEQVFTARLRVVSTDKAKGFYSGRSIDDGDAQFLGEALIGWQDLIDAKNKPIAFNAKRRDWLLGVPFVRRAIADTYIRAVGGVRPSES